MINVKVLGPGCANCRFLESIVREVASAHNVPIEVEKVTDYFEVLEYQIIATPGLVISGKVVSAGRIPGEDEITRWLKT